MKHTKLFLMSLLIGISSLGLQRAQAVEIEEEHKGAVQACYAYSFWTGSCFGKCSYPSEDLAVQTLLESVGKTDDYFYGCSLISGYTYEYKENFNSNMREVCYTTIAKGLFKCIYAW
ncbi:MAG: hypothetical protein V4596_03530 [Bdellovibrionota bacterium]